MRDLLELTAELVDIPSVSFEEDQLVSFIEKDLSSISHLSIDRVGDNLVARTNFNKGQRLILAGHTDTVPGDTEAGSRIDNDTCWGLGSADMKGGIAVMLELAQSVTEYAIDVTWIFYAREEVESEHNGLKEIFTKAPELLSGDAAVLGEPTSALIEAGCQGTMRFLLRFKGERAHSARPWMGRNAVHRLSGVLDALEKYQYREPLIEGCKFREALQAVGVEGGVAGNVIPDMATLLINHRHAPDRNSEEAEKHIREFLKPYMEHEDSVELIDRAPAATPGMNHSLLASIGEGIETRAKLGWTDVAFFSEQGIPAINFGPGDATLAHTSEERIERENLEITFATIKRVLEGN
jgi:succinyl-diaminopimelate desuccinylase